MLLIIVESLAYDFKKIDITRCVPRGDEFATLEHAKYACKTRIDCHGILNPNCSSVTSYVLCNKNAKIISNKFVKDCYYEKYALGEILE